MTESQLPIVALSGVLFGVAVGLILPRARWSRKVWASAVAVHVAGWCLYGYAVTGDYPKTPLQAVGHMALYGLGWFMVAGIPVIVGLGIAACVTQRKSIPSND